MNSLEQKFKVNDLVNVTHDRSRRLGDMNHGEHGIVVEARLFQTFVETHWVYHVLLDNGLRVVFDEIELDKEGEGLQANEECHFCGKVAVTKSMTKMGTVVTMCALHKMLYGR